jgi:hypothetical protein
MKNGLDSPFSWLRFVALTGRQGEQWVEKYEQVRPLVQLCVSSVVGLRRGGTHHESAALLQRARAGLDALNGDTDPAVRSAADRSYYGALGFHFYTQRAFDEADDSMSRAHNAVVQTVNHGPWLTGLAYDCFEFELHRARIARDRCRWDAMRQHAEASAAMRAGRRPFCMLDDGSQIALADLRRFYNSLPLTEEDRAMLARIVDDETGPREAERFVRSMFRLSGFVIEYA